MHARAKDELKDTLRTWYAEYRQTGRVLYRGDERKIHAYTHEEMAAKFADVLESVSTGEVSQACAAHV